jgi:hypothetical protein
MESEITLYITSPKTICTSKWMGFFVQKLQMALSRTSNVSINYIIKNSEKEVWQDAINKASFFIAILDANENADESYLNELYAISDKLQNSSHLPEKSQLFKISLSPDKDIHQPAIFRQLCGYNFFEFFGRKETITVLDFNNKEQSAIAWNLLLDLAFDFKDSLNAVKKKDDKNIQEQKYIYLSRCSSDIITIRDELKRELQHLGFSVLPKTDISFNTETIENIIQDNLGKSSYVIELLGGKYGDIKQGENISLIEKENTIISNALAQLPNLHRLVWIPDFLKRKEQRQELYINRIKQKEADSTTEIIESSTDEFKDILALRLIKGQKHILQKSIAGEVYLIVPPESNYDQINELAQSLNLKLNTIDQGNQETLYHQHLDLLAQSNNILIHWVNKDQYWLKSKLSDLVKAPGLGKKEPFHTIGIMANGTPPDLTTVLNWLPDIKVIQHDNTEEIKKHFQRIIE